jgi:hypothetical protein
MSDTPTTTIKVIPDLEEIKRALSLLFEPGQVVELRALDVSTPSYKKPHTVSGYYDDLDKCAKDAAQVSPYAAGVYVVLNPFNPALLARSANKSKPDPKTTTGDADITRRRRLLIDCDPIRPAGISASDDEKAYSLEVAFAMRELLSNRSWPDPILADSGNGTHLLYPIDQPAQDNNLIKHVLLALADFWNDDRVTIDTSVYNPARISKLYGTIARKGDNVPDRSHRLARILDFPDRLEVVSTELLEEIAKEAPEPVSKTQPRPAGTGRSDFDLDRWIAEHNLDIGSPRAWGSGRKWVFNVCPWNPDHRDKSAYIVQFANGAIAAGCQHNWCKSKGNDWHALRDVIEPGWNSRGNGHHHVDEIPEPPSAWPDEVMPIDSVNAQLHNLSDPQENINLPLAVIDSTIPDMPELPEAAQVPESAGAQACPWLDDYIRFSRQWSPRAFDGFHEAVGLWVLSTVAARRVRCNFGKQRFGNLYIALTARTSLFAKSSTAEIGLQTIQNAGLNWLLAADSATPQKFVADLTPRLSVNYDELDDEQRTWARLRLALPGQRGWYYDEFGQHIAAMLREGGYMADFRGLLRKFDDTPERYEYGSIGRGNDVIELPYLALLANLTPDDLRQFAKRGSALWGDGFLARFALITPPEGERKTDRFPAGERNIPSSLSEPLQKWHQRLGMPDVRIFDVLNEKNEKTGKKFERTPRPAVNLVLDPAVFDAIYAYQDGLLDLIATQDNHDLDGNYARFGEKALRIALLLASVNGDLRVEMHHWARAQAITERWRAGLHELYIQVNQPPPSEDRENEERVLSIIARRQQATKRELRQRIRLDGMSLDRAITALLDAGLIEKLKVGKKEVYTMIGESVDA